MALFFLNREIGKTEVVAERFWEGDGTVNVGLTYDLTITDPKRAAPLIRREVIQCRYALVPKNPDARVEMVGLRQRGVELDKEQRRKVNIGMRVFR